MVRLANICKSLRVPQCTTLLRQVSNGLRQCSNAADPSIIEKADHVSTHGFYCGARPCIEADKCPIEPECSTLKPPNQRWRNPSLRVISTVVIIVASMVMLASAGVISSVADRVYVSLVLAMDIGMVAAMNNGNLVPELALAMDIAIMYYRRSYSTGSDVCENVDSDVSIAQEGLAGESAHFQLAEHSITARQLVLPLEICYAVIFASSPVLIAIGVAVLSTLVLQWLWRMLIMQTSACIMDDLNAPIPEALKKNFFFDAVSTVTTIAMTGVGVSRFILMS